MTRTVFAGQTASVQEGIAEELAEVLRVEAERRGVPGCAAGVLCDGQAITASYGVTSVEHPLDVTSDTLFQVASITKTFTAAGVMTLVEEGRLALEDPVVAHLPTLRATTDLDTDAITIEHLLSHQAGFDGDHLFVLRSDDLDELKNARRLFPPGTAFSYNNAAFSIAGAVIEQVSGQPFRPFMRDRFFRPLGMKSACFRADDAILNRVAAPHYVDGDRIIVIRGAGWQRGWELAPGDWPAGGLIASVDHLLAWSRFQLDGRAADGRRLLAEESLERLHAPVVTASCTEDVALDWSVRRVGDVTTISHHGLTAGYCSVLVIAPERGIAIVCLTHAVNGASVNDAVYRWAMHRLTGSEVRDPIPDPSLDVECAGEFLSPFARLTVARADAPGTIVVTSAPRDDVDGWKPPVEPPIRLAFFQPDHAVSLDAPGPTFVMRVGFADNGTAAWVSWGGRRSPRIA